MLLSSSHVRMSTPAHKKVEVANVVINVASTSLRPQCSLEGPVRFRSKFLRAEPLISQPPINPKSRQPLSTVYLSRLERNTGKEQAEREIERERERER